jgi:uncharacterized protein YbjT (DUF2867 family)
MLKLLVVAAAGGLGREVVREALSRGHTVSVLVRDQAKLSAALSPDVLARLASIHVGDGTDASAVSKAAAGQDVVFGPNGGNPAFARTVAEQTKAAGARKFIFVAGGTNIAMDDGTPGVEYWAQRWPPARAAFASHQACIDAIRATGVTNVVFCPGLMQSLGAKSSPPAPVLRAYPMNGSPMVSYEDAAHVLLEAAEKADWDNQLITAVAPAQGGKREL